MSASILLELGKLAEVRAWTSQEAWSEELGSTYEVRQFDPRDLPIREFNWADVSFFNIGNDARFHKDIFNVSRMVPGIQILHDVKLAHFFAAYAEGDELDKKYYRREMEQEGLGDEAEKFLTGELSFGEFADQAGLVNAALRPAIAAILHNSTESSVLAETTNIPLFYLPLCLSHPMGVAPRRIAHSDGSRVIRLVVFGFIGKNRCLPEILHAIAGCPQREQYILDVYGIFEEASLVERLIQQLNLGSQVNCRGFVEDKVLEAGLAEAELAINLRNPTMGEASGSQLRIWENELPALVSNTGWYSTLPKEAVFHIDEGNEVSGVREHLVALRRSPERYREAGRYGRRILEREHRPEDYARSLIEISRQIPMLFGRKIALTLAHRSGQLLLEATGHEPFKGITSSIASRISEVTYRTV